MNYAGKIIICDIDGTLANHEGRSPYDESKVLQDSVYENIASMVRLLDTQFVIIIVSGRHNSCEADTRKWLHDNNIPFDFLFMRKAGDDRPDTVIKQEIFNTQIREIFDSEDILLDSEDILFVIDDRPKVIRMWRENGLTVLAARGEIPPEGDF